MQRRPWSLNIRTRRQIARAYGDGMPVAIIARLYDVSPQYPGQVAQHYGIPPRRPDLTAAKRRVLL